ncbi:hypothetical protein ACJMQP_04135 [Rhodopseudomonas palustris]
MRGAAAPLIVDDVSEPASEVPEPVTTTYAALGGSGFRMGALNVVSTFEATRSVSQMFDGVTTGGNLWFVSQDVAGRYIEVKFNGSRAGRVIDGLKIYTDSGGKGNFTATVDGSLDGEHWTTLTSFVADEQAIQEVTWTNSARFVYYRITGVSGRMSDNPYWREIEFRIDATSPVAKGDRSALVALSSNLGTWSGTLGQLIDGVENASVQFNNGQGAGSYIEFGFPSPVQITAAYMLPGDGAMGVMGYWKWQYWDAVAGAWADITTPAKWVNGLNGTATFRFVNGDNWFDLTQNSVAATRYRMLCTDREIGNDPVREIQFMVEGA